MTDLLDKLYEPKKHFMKGGEASAFVPKIKITVEDTKTKQILQFVAESTMKMHGDKEAQERLREDMHARLNIVLDKIFQGWK